MTESYSDEYREEDVQQVQDAELAPAGTYVTTPPLYLTERVGDRGGNDGRKQFSFFGGATLTQADGTQVRESFRFTLSPQPRFNHDNPQYTGTRPDKPDTASRLWSQAVKLYKAQVGTPTSNLEVAQHLTKYPVALRVIAIKGDGSREGGNYVMDISEPRERE